MIYVDRNKPNSSVSSFDPIVSGVNENRYVNVQSLDGTAGTVNVLMNIGASLSDSAVLALATTANQASQTDVNQFQYGVYGVNSGNNVITVVTFRPTGTYNIQRFPGYLTSTIYGAASAT